MQPFTAIAVDAALDDPRTWTRLDTLPGVVSVEPDATEARRPAELWYTDDAGDFQVSTQGRVRSARSGRYLQRHVHCEGGQGWWRCRRPDGSLVRLHERTRDRILSRRS